MQIKAAFRLLAKKYHPDLVSPAQRVEAERRFKLIAEAHAQLTHGAQTRSGVSCTRPGVQHGARRETQGLANDLRAQGEGWARARARRGYAGGSRGEEARG